VFALPKSNKKISSRKQINIKGVQDDTLLLPGNRYRAVLQVSSINFELKSEAEQDAIIDIYQSFLNSLPFSVQIVARIREVDLQKYLEDLRRSIAHEKQEIYKQQIKHYIEFVEQLIKTNKILTRHFYVVVPCNGEADLVTAQQQLAISCDIVSKGLGRLGVQSRRLTSLELLDLFYSFYSPKLAKRQPFVEQTLQLLNESYLQEPQHA